LPAQELTQTPPETPLPGKKPKIALVLSGGAALGFAHLGFLKVLEEVGIPVDIVIGTSMGSLIGALYAAGYSPGDIETVSSQINWAQVFLNEGADRIGGLLEERRPIFTLAFDRAGMGDKKGLLPDQNITLLLSRLVYRVSMVGDFAALPLPFKAVAVDIANGVSVPLESGPLYRAMRASMSIPVVFPPAPLNGTYLVDGGLLDNNPVDLALEWGADIIIDVDVGSFASRPPAEINGAAIVIDQTIRLIQSTGILPNPASGREDYRLAMDLSDFFWTDFAKSKALIDRGEQLTRSTESMKALLDLAAEIEKARPLERRDWRRSGAYSGLPEPVFSRVRLVSIGTDAAPVDEKTRLAQFPQKYLDSLFDGFFNKPPDLSKIEAAIEILRRRGNFESLGYHLEAIPGGGNSGREYTLALTGVHARERKNDFSFALDADLLWGEHSRIGMTDYIDLRFRDLFLPNSLLSAGFSYKFSDVQGPGGALGYTQELSSIFTLGLNVDGGYYASTILAFQPVGELSTFGFMNAAARFAWKPADFFELSASYRYAPLWYEDKVSGVAYAGDLHLAGLALNFDTLKVTRPRFFAFFYNLQVRLSVEFPFAGQRLYDGTAGGVAGGVAGGNIFPWYERLEAEGRKAWIVRPWRNFIFDANFASYRGELESEWTLFNLSGIDGVPGYSGDAVPGRERLIIGASYLEEITPLSNLLAARSFFRFTVRGGNLWTHLESIEQLAQWRGGARAGLQIETPLGIIFFGPELSFEGAFQFCVFFNSPRN
jgi:predicted acylesterase/phospholipase RssA